MSLANRVIDAIDPTLEDAEIGFGVVCGHGFVADLVSVLAPRVIDRVMLAELSPELNGWRGLVSVERALAACVLSDDRPSVFAVTSATWRERARPPRSTSVKTAFLGAGSR
jgi:hypothetical protein